MSTKTKAKDAPEGEQHDPNTGEIVKVQGQGGALAGFTDDDLAGYAADAGAGFDNQTGDDTAIPFLAVLQPGSPEVQGEDARGKSGQIINRTTGDIYSGKEGLAFVPALTEHVMVEWIPKDKGGGIVAVHAFDSPISQKVRSEQPLGKYKLPNGNDLVETFYVYGVAVNPEGIPFPAVVPFSSTFIKEYKSWMFRLRSIVIPLGDGRKITAAQMPMWSHAYAIRTEMQKKNDQTWYTPTIRFAGSNEEDSRIRPTDELYVLARSVYEAVKSGAKRAATETMRSEAPSGGPRGSTSDEEAPY